MRSVDLVQEYLILKSVMYFEVLYISWQHKLDDIGLRAKIYKGYHNFPCQHAWLRPWWRGEAPAQGANINKHKIGGLEVEGYILCFCFNWSCLHPDFGVFCSSSVQISAFQGITFSCSMSEIRTNPVFKHLLYSIYKYKELVLISKSHCNLPNVPVSFQIRWERPWVRL